MLKIHIVLSKKTLLKEKIQVFLIVDIVQGTPKVNYYLSLLFVVCHTRFRLNYRKSMKLLKMFKKNKRNIGEFADEFYFEIN